MNIALFKPKNNLSSGRVGVTLGNKYIVDVLKTYSYYLMDEYEVRNPAKLARAVFPKDINEFISLGDYVLAKIGVVLNYAYRNLNDLKDLKAVYDLAQVKLLPPVKPSKLIGIGLNYEEYRVKLNYPRPEVPLFFLKPPSTIIGHEDIVVIPKGRLPGTSSKILFHEFELCVVIGKKTRRVSRNEAYNYVFGYTIFSDITAHDIEMIQPGHVLYQQRCKAFDTFSPIGPWIVHRKSIENPNKLDILRRRNNVVEGRSNTENMIFKVDEIVEFLSEIMTLEPGDAIGMGSPPTGPDKGLQPGDTIEVEIEKIGVLKNYVKESNIKYAEAK